jgi:hypothetical protein
MFPNAARGKSKSKSRARGKSRKTLDHGDRTKRISSGIHDDNHPVARALGRVAEEYLPEFVVARGKDPEGVDCTERSVLYQQKIEHHKRLRDAGIPRSVHQVLHTDKEMYSSHGGIDLEHIAHAQRKLG